MSLSSFITNLKKGERDVVSLLGMRSSDFREASFGEIMANEDDVIAHVNRVQVYVGGLFFKLFNNFLIKHNDFGDVEYIFYTTTDDAEHIIGVADVLFQELGEGFFDGTQFSSFKNHSKVNLIAQGQHTKMSDAPMQIWHHENLAICLYYRINPLRQLTFTIQVNAPKEKDISVRKKGTILDLLDFDPIVLLTKEPTHQVENYSSNTVKFVDYTYLLESREMGLFNVIEIRVFGEKRVFNKFLQTHVTLTTEGPVSSDKKIAVVEALLRIYGNDNHNSGDLEFYERTKLEEGTFWIGRYWSFNEAHAPYDFNNPGEKMSYEVRVDNMEDTDSFKVSILSYNNLVAQFGVS